MIKTDKIMKDFIKRMFVYFTTLFYVVFVCSIDAMPLLLFIMGCIYCICLGIIWHCYISKEDVYRYYGVTKEEERY